MEKITAMLFHFLVFRKDQQEDQQSVQMKSEALIRDRIYAALPFVDFCGDAGGLSQDFQFTR